LAFIGQTSAGAFIRRYVGTMHPLIAKTGPHSTTLANTPDRVTKPFSKQMLSSLMTRVGGRFFCSVYSDFDLQFANQAAM
jgi:hypothetical protein